MAASPEFKVYSADNEYLAAFKYVEHAAMLLAGLSERGATIRHGHSKRGIGWTDGVDGEVAESYDTVANTVFSRCKVPYYGLRRPRPSRM